jgi:hypothetical protein
MSLTHNPFESPSMAHGLFYLTNVLDFVLVGRFAEAREHQEKLDLWFLRSFLLEAQKHSEPR